MHTQTSSCILDPRAPQSTEITQKPVRRKKTRVRGIPGGAETGAHQAPPAPQKAPQRGLGADRSRIGPRNLRTTPRPSKRSRPHPPRLLQLPNPHPTLKPPSTPRPQHPHLPCPKTRRPTIPPPITPPIPHRNPRHQQTPPRPPRPHTLHPPRRPNPRPHPPAPALPLTRHADQLAPGPQLPISTPSHLTKPHTHRRRITPDRPPDPSTTPSHHHTTKPPNDNQPPSGPSTTPSHHH